MHMRRVVAKHISRSSQRYRTNGGIYLDDPPYATKQAPLGYDDRRNNSREGQWTIPVEHIS